MGIRYYQLRLVDRHWPRWNADFGDFAADASAVADFDQPPCGNDDVVCGVLRRVVPAASHGPALGGLLAGALSERACDLAAVSKPAGLGRVCGNDVFNGFGSVLVCGFGSRLGNAPR